MHRSLDLRATVCPERQYASTTHFLVLSQMDFVQDGVFSTLEKCRWQFPSFPPSWVPRLVLWGLGTSAGPHGHAPAAQEPCGGWRSGLHSLGLHLQLSRTVVCYFIFTPWEPCDPHCECVVFFLLPASFCKAQMTAICRHRCEGSAPLTRQMKKELVKGTSEFHIACRQCSIWLGVRYGDLTKIVLSSFTNVPLLN